METVLVQPFTAFSSRYKFANKILQNFYIISKGGVGEYFVSRDMKYNSYNF